MFKIKYHTTFVFVLFCFLSSAYSQIQNIQQVNSDGFPALSIKNDSVDIELHQMSIDVKIMSNIALTTYDITFYNPLNRLLEGEVNFPLKSNQQIVGFAMDVDGTLRDGVVVEKDKGRRVFESIVRRGVDPGLLEKITGNNFRLRVYPISARGTKRIRITCQEELKETGGDLIYQLPLRYTNVIEDFSISIEAIKQDTKPNIAQNDFTKLNFKNVGNNYKAVSLHKKVHPSGLFQMKLPVKENPTLFTTRSGNFFYGTFPVEVKPNQKSKLNHIALLWDISGSGLNRDVDKEMELLSEYLKFNDDTKVSIYTFNHQFKKRIEVQVKEGNANVVIDEIKNWCMMVEVGWIILN